MFGECRAVCARLFVLSCIRIESHSMALSGECIVGEKIARRKPRPEMRDVDAAVLRPKTAFLRQRNRSPRNSCFSLETFRVCRCFGTASNTRRMNGVAGSGKSRENFSNRPGSAPAPGRRAPMPAAHISNLKHFGCRTAAGPAHGSSESLLRLDCRSAGLLFASRAARQATMRAATG